MPSGSAARRARTERRKRNHAVDETPEVPELHDRIASRAYRFFEERGQIDGYDLDDWLRAEQELLSERMDTDLG